MAVLVAIAATVVILSPALLISWHFATRADDAALRRIAEHLLGHAESIFDDAVDALGLLNASDEEPCSADQIALLRNTSLQSLFINNIAYSEGGFVRCNAFGMVSRPISSDYFDTQLADGFDMVVNWRGRIPRRGPVMIIRKGSYSVLIDQRLLYQHVGTGEDDKSFQFRTLNGTVIEAGDGHGFPTPDTNQTVAVLEADHWILMASAPKLGFLEYAWSVRPIIVPIAVALALLVGAASMWFLLQPLTGRAIIERAVRDRRFVVHYQPIMELATQRCVAAEALIRLERPDGTLVGPDVFIPYAVESGLMETLTDLVIDSVVREMGPLLRTDPSFHVSINLEAEDIVTGRILGALDRALKDSGIAPEQIWLEMTERGFMNIEGARPILEELSRRGHCIAIDDFGTGYSGLQYLAKLPVEMLKIDKSFIETVGTAAPTSRVTDQIIAMARELKLGLVAEGVETEAQAAFLRSERVEYAQGWLFSRAVPAGDLLAFLTRNRATAGQSEPAASAGAA